MLVKVEAYHDGTFWCGGGIGACFFTQGKTLDELIRNTKQVASLHFNIEFKHRVRSLLLVYINRIHEDSGDASERPRFLRAVIFLTASYRKNHRV